MKLLVEPMNKENLKFNCDGLILAIKDYAVESNTYFTLEEIKNISDSFSGEIFVKLNKNLMNDDIPFVKDILVQLDKMNITGVFFYDLAVLELKRELNLNIDLVWNQTHMVNNYKTCNYYYSKGVKYALLGKEITLDEILEIIDLSDITSMVEVVSKPSVAFSKRKLVSNYYKDMITNGTGIIRDLYDNGCSYIIMREYGIDNFRELVNDTMEYIKDSCSDLSYVLKYKKLGDSTNFFFKKTIYRVKKNG